MNQPATRPSTRLRVLCLHTATLPPLGADTWVHSRIIRDLDRSEHDVHVAYTFERDGAPTPTAVALSEVSDVTRLDVRLGLEREGRPRRSRRAAAQEAVLVARDLLRVIRHVRRHRIDIVHTSDRPRDALAAVLIGRLTRARSVIHLHVVVSSWMSRPLRWAIEHADARIAVSRFVADSVPAAGFDGPTHVVLNAIEPDRWMPGEGREGARAELGLTDADVVVITVCRLFEEKGVARLIRAFAATAEAQPTAHLVIVGHDVTGGTYLDELHRMVDEAGIADRVLFTGRRSDVPRLMAAADVFAMPSFEEPFGLVFAEAMAMRLPIVALDNGGTREVVVAGVTGLLSPVGDDERLANDLRTLMCDPELRERLGDAGRRHVEEQFRTERMAADTARAYRLIASRRN